MSDPVFVFGSNLAGRHGAGAAKWAVENRGAIYGKGIGLQGNSYAIPTKDRNIKTLPLESIWPFVLEFMVAARNMPDTEFQLTPIGCGLAGYTPEQIAPMFKGSPPNVVMPPEFAEVLTREAATPKSTYIKRPYAGSDERKPR